MMISQAHKCQTRYFQEVFYIEGNIFPIEIDKSYELIYSAVELRCKLSWWNPADVFTSRDLSRGSVLLTLQRYSGRYIWGSH